MDQAWRPQEVTPEQAEKRRIRRSANFCGALLLAMLAVQILIGLVLGMVGAFGLLDLTRDDYGLSNTAYILMNMLLYVLFLVAPTMGVAAFARSRVNPFPSRFVKPSLFLCLLLAGMGMAVLSNVLTNYLMMFLNGFGIQSPQFYDPIAYTTTSLILNVISTAVLPALVEEMIFRGYLMGTLRPHGDGIALVLSAFVFGLFHGNILQFPFAFMLGLVLGWLVIQTGSIWPAVALHFGNNLMSVLLSFFAKGYAEDTANSITGATFAALSAAGVVAIGALLIADRRGGTGRRDMLRPIGNGASLFTVRRRVWYTLTSPVLLISFIAMIAVLVLSLEVA